MAGLTCLSLCALDKNEIDKYIAPIKIEVFSMPCLWYGDILIQ